MRLRIKKKKTSVKEHMPCFFFFLIFSKTKTYFNHILIRKPKKSLLNYVSININITINMFELLMPC